MALFAERDRALARLQTLSGRSTNFYCTFTPESLKRLEQWYFNLLDRDGFQELGISQEQFEDCIAAYFGELLVRNAPPFEWFVAEYAFAPGRYEIGIRRPRESIMLSLPMAPDPRESNKLQLSLWRAYRQYAG